MSREYVLRHETAFAQVNVSSEGRYLLPGFYNYIFTTLAWNNDDFCEETKTGNGTTRVTSGIIIQRQSYQVEELVRISVARSSLLESPNIWRTSGEDFADDLKLCQAADAEKLTL